MLHSMTGFGSAVNKGDDSAITVELKTVNNRYFKLSLRITDGYSAFEQRIEALLRQTIERGTVNATIRITPTRESAGHHINVPVLHSYMKQFADAMRTLDESAKLSLGSCYAPDRLLSLPGIIVTDNEHSEVDNEKIWPLLETTIREALDALQTMRQTEGESMKKDLVTNVELLRELLGNITELAPRVAPNYRQKLQERIEKVLAEQELSLGDADFIRELAIFADRCDISEELVRFQSHLEQFTSALQSSESCGRKLDFLTQELFREVNTIGSKANDADITKNVVEIKAIIERIREMVQNVE